MAPFPGTPPMGAAAPYWNGSMPPPQPGLRRATSVRRTAAVWLWSTASVRSTVAVRGYASIWGTASIWSAATVWVHAAAGVWRAPAATWAAARRGTGQRGRTSSVAAAAAHRDSGGSPCSCGSANIERVREVHAGNERVRLAVNVVRRGPHALFSRNVQLYYSDPSLA